MARNGAPWLFGTDSPEQLCEPLGWSAVVTDVAEPGNKWNRWFAPAVPLRRFPGRAARLLRHRHQVLDPEGGLRALARAVPPLARAVPLFTGQGGFGFDGHSA